MVPESSRQSQGDKAAMVFVLSLAIGLSSHVLSVVSVVVGLLLQRVDIHHRGEVRQMLCEGVLIESRLLLVEGLTIDSSNQTSNDVYSSNIDMTKILASVFYTSDDSHKSRSLMSVVVVATWKG